MALRKEVPPFGLPVKKSLYVGRLCRPFLAFLHGLIVGHIFPFQRFRLQRCPETDGAVVDVHPLVPFAVQLVGLGYHDLVNGTSRSLKSGLPRSRWSGLAYKRRKN